MIAKAKTGLPVRGVFETQNAGDSGAAFRGIHVFGKVAASTMTASSGGTSAGGSTTRKPCFIQPATSSASCIRSHVAAHLP